MLFILVDVLVAEVNIEHTSAGFFQLAIQRRQQFRFESRLHQRVVLVLHVQNQKIVLKIPKNKRFKLTSSIHQHETKKTSFGTKESKGFTPHQQMALTSTSLS